jgi:hypothetical protein
VAHRRAAVSLRARREVLMAAQPTQLSHPQPGASLSDLLTAVKNLVIALNAATAAFDAVNGISTIHAITGPTVVKTSAGRVAAVSIITPGSTTGLIYDSASIAQTMPLWVIPEAAQANGQPYVVNLPADSGILVVPGTGQSVTVSWS